MTDEPRALDGLRVLDLSRLLPGPYATMVLRDLGASVDKVEEPRGGDYMRAFPPHVGGMNATFVGLNRGKRSLSLDLKKDEGREAFLRLVAHYDVVVESFRPGVMERLGLGYSVLQQKNPRLVYCAITGYGQDGPLSQRAGHDLNYLARAGVLGITGPGDGPPQVHGVQIADVGGGSLYAVVGILAALTARESTGKGRFVDVSMCEGSMAMALYGLTSHFGGLPLPRGEGILMGGIAPYRTYRTKDGGAVALAALEPKFWRSFCKIAGLEASMEALAPGPHQEGWIKKVAAAIAEKTRDEWAELAAAADCCLEPVLTPDEALADPQHHHRGSFVDAPAGGRVVSTPVALAGGGRKSEGPAPGPAPDHGADGRAILREAGFTPAECDVLAAAGATDS
ncbi:MAG: CoA transferase [Deltaproteobacteria bacterium]|nr:CoA transferase [Deltaproteobacteria bacterium]